MGAGQSSGIEIGGSSMGYQVLRVYPNSPGGRAGLKAYFDFIIAIGNTRFNKENGSLREILTASVDEKIKMVVYNTRTKTIREVEIVPTTSWGGSGLLGVSIKHSSFERADERVWHVVEVEPGSPAHNAGFKAGEDYVIGSDSILQESDDLYNLVEAHEGKALKLFVYNVKSDNCREVICHPNSRWGGKGFLGCEFGNGLLHRIPYASPDGASGDTTNNKPMMNNQSMIGRSQPQQKQQQQQQQQQFYSPNNNSHTFHNQLMQHQMQQLQRLPTSQQPGNQLLQLALSPIQPQQLQQQHQQQHQQQLQQQLQQQHQQQLQQQLQQQQQQQQQQHQQQESSHGWPGMAVAQPQLPQTFAQLAQAMYQPPSQQSPPPPSQQSPPPPSQPPSASQQPTLLSHQPLPTSSQPPPQAPSQSSQFPMIQSQPPPLSAQVPPPSSQPSMVSSQPPPLSAQVLPPPSQVLPPPSQPPLVSQQPPMMSPQYPPLSSPPPPPSSPPPPPPPFSQQSYLIP